MTTFFRYVLVGAFSTALHYALLVFGVELLAWPAYAASGFGAVVGAQLAYAGNRSLTFSHRGAIKASWLKFQTTALLGALAGMAIVGLGVRLGLHYLWAQGLATLLVLGLTFGINRYWTFRRDP